MRGWFGGLAIIRRMVKRGSRISSQGGRSVTDSLLDWDWLVDVEV